MRRVVVIVAAIAAAITAAVWLNVRTPVTKAEPSVTMVPDAQQTAGRAAAAQAAPIPFDSSLAWEHLRQMVAIGPRPAGSPALQKTRDYIKKQIAAAGLTIEEQTFTAKTPNGPVQMVNLITKLPGQRPERILITGHYDTKIIKTSVFVGASDGASSAAMLIELARVLKSRPRTFTYEFVWFDGEEAVCLGWDDCKDGDGGPDNTYGSRYYVANAKKTNTLASIKTMLLLDMVGAKDLKIKRETEFSKAWLNDIFWASAKKLGYGSTFLDEDGPVGGDDHEPFATAGVATIDLIDLNDYPQWHNMTCCDDLNHVAAKSLQIVGEVVIAALPEVEKVISK